MRKLTFRQHLTRRMRHEARYVLRGIQREGKKILVKSLLPGLKRELKKILLDFKKVLAKRR